MKGGAQQSLALGAYPRGWAPFPCHMVDHPALAADVKALGLYSIVIARVRRTPITVTLRRGEVVPLDIGQCIVSERELATRLDLGKKGARLLLERLAKHEIWHLARHRYGTIVTLCDAAAFAECDWTGGTAGGTAEEPQRNHSGTAEEPQRNRRGTRIETEDVRRKTEDGRRSGPRERAPRRVKAADVTPEPFDLEAALGPLGPNANAARELVGRLAAARRTGLAQSVTARVVAALADVAGEFGPEALGHGLRVTLDNGRFDFSGSGDSAAKYVRKVASNWRAPTLNGRAHQGGGNSAADRLRARAAELRARGQ